MSYDPELETFLRQFRPRRPGPLGRPRRGRRWWLVAAAAAVVLGAALGGRLVHRGGRQPPPAAVVADGGLRPTVGALRGALHAGTYEAALDELEARVLPDPARQGGALRTLADVNQDR